jgi:hypothetical protein
MAVSALGSIASIKVDGLAEGPKDTTEIHYGKYQLTVDESIKNIFFIHVSKSLHQIYLSTDKVINFKKRYLNDETLPYYPSRPARLIVDLSEPSFDWTGNIFLFSIFEKKIFKDGNERTYVASEIDISFFREVEIGKDDESRPYIGKIVDEEFFGAKIDLICPVEDWPSSQSQRNIDPDPCIANVALTLQAKIDNKEADGALLRLKGIPSKKLMSWLRGRGPLSPSPVKDVSIVLALPYETDTGREVEYDAALKKVSKKFKLKILNVDDDDSSQIKTINVKMKQIIP